MVADIFKDFEPPEKNFLATPLTIFSFNTFLKRERFKVYRGLNKTVIALCNVII